MKTPNRKPNRLKSYDYGELGSYFVTLCTHKRQPCLQIENPPVGNGTQAVSYLHHKEIALADLDTAEYPAAIKQILTN